jgi:hypothetical protein
MYSSKTPGMLAIEGGPYWEDVAVDQGNLNEVLEIRRAAIAALAGDQTNQLLGGLVQGLEKFMNPSGTWGQEYYPNPTDAVVTKFTDTWAAIPSN